MNFPDADEKPVTDEMRSDQSTECACAEMLALDYVSGDCSESVTHFVQAHRAECLACELMIENLAQTSGLLAFASTSAAPSPTAKLRLLERIESDPRTSDKSESVFVGSMEGLRTPTLPASTATDSPAQAGSGQATASLWTRFSAPLLVVPVLMALGIVSFWGLNTYNDLENERSSNGLLNDQVALLNNRVESLTGDMDGIDTVLSEDSSKKYAMTAMPSAKSRDATGLLVVNSQTEEAAILVWDLDPDQNAYEVLVGLPNGESRTISDLYVDGSGDGMKMFDLDNGLTNVTSVHIRPKMVDTMTDSPFAAVQPDVLYGSIIAGLDINADTMQRQP